jgi:hypothetical protein
MIEKYSYSSFKSKNSNIFFFIFSGLVRIHQEVFRLHRTYTILSAHDAYLDRPLAVI